MNFVRDFLTYVAAIVVSGVVGIIAHNYLRRAGAPPELALLGLFLAASLIATWIIRWLK